MFFQFQAPDEEPNCNTTSLSLKSNARSRRQKKLRRKNKLKTIKKYQNQITTATIQKARTAVPTVPITMSSWAEDFTKAATWQLKNEVAFWKSKAKALEYENKILHATIRQNSIEVETRKKYHNDSRATLVQFERDSPVIPNLSDSDDESCENASPVRGPSVPEFEVSEEYIQFLRDNQVYRDSARQERERIKAQDDAEKREVEEMEAGPTENVEDTQETLKKLYGDGWERILALEMSLKTQFISICDQDKPMYWPNIPFNFNFG